MRTDFNHDQRPEAMADVPGVCQLPLTSAIVQYRDRHEVAVPGGRIRDIGLGLVLEGRYASASEAIDLGSSAVKILDLSGELVVLDWVYDPTLEYMRGLVASVGRGDSRAAGELQAYGLRLALRVLGRVGFGPLTRPTLLRLGFRDLCRDLDLNEETSVRFLMGPGSVTRAHLDYDGNALLFRTLESGPVPALELALGDAFPDTDIRMLPPDPAQRDSGASGTSYQVRFPLPLSHAETVAAVGRIRSGFEALLRRFEPERFGAVAGHLRAFGNRSTLSALARAAGHSAPGSGVPRGTAAARTPGTLGSDSRGERVH